MNTPSPITLNPEFDWYQFTAGAELRQVREVLEPLQVEERFHDESPKLKGYGFAVKLGGVGGSVLVHYGGRNGDEYGPNVAGTGPMAIEVARVVREAALPHGCGRVDVRMDFLGDYESCRALFIDRCNVAGMASKDEGSCPESNKQEGRSVYAGARSSLYRPTLYQKGIQLGDGLPENYLRLEHRFMPTKAEEKRQLSVLSPVQVAGLRPVSRDLSQAIAGLAVAPYKLTKFAKEKTPYFWMLKQYESVLSEMKQDHGTWAAVGCQIGLDLEEMQEEVQRQT